MKLKKVLAMVLCIAMVLGTMSISVFADNTDIIEVGTDKACKTLSAAVAAATDADGDKEITYHIYGKVEVSGSEAKGWINPRGTSGATTVNFVGMTDDAEISLTHNSSDNWTQIMGTDNVKMDAINYSNLILSKPNGIWCGDVAHQNIMFTTWMRGASTSATVTYTNCVFPNGSGNNQYGRTVYTDCDFYSDDYYALWIYDAGDNFRADTTPASVEVTGGTFVADRGVKVYSEEQNGTAQANTTISNSTFDIESTPAVVSSVDGTITMADVDYDACEYGLLEMGYLNGNPRYSLAEATIDGETPKYVAAVTTTNEWNSTSTVYVTDMDYAEHIVEKNAAYGAGTIAKPVAMVGTSIYASLEAAIAAATGEEITLLADAELNTKLNNDTINIDLNGHTMYVNVGSNYIIGENSISNGTIDISNASSSQNIFGLAQSQTPATTLTMDKVNFIGDGFNSGYAVFEIGNSGADVALTVTNSTIDLKNDNADQGGFVKGYGPNCVLTITNTDVTLDNTDMFNVYVSADITDSEFIISNLTDTAFRNLGGTIDNSVISVTNSGNGIRNSSAGYNLALENNSSVKISGSTNTEAGKVGDLVLAAGNKVNVDATSELLVETSTIANADDVTGNVVSKADVVYVQYKKVDVDANDNDTVEGSDEYEIVLAGYDAEKINELASADLTFAFNGTLLTGEAMTYTVVPADGVTLTQLGDRFMFNYDGVNKYEETGTAIVIGTITIEGYGSYTLATANSGKNAVYATEIRNNIVDGFTPAAGLEINKDMVANDGMVGEIPNAEIAVPTRKLTIDIDFNNPVDYSGKDYQDMTVIIDGGTYYEEIKLGDKAEDDTIVRNLAINTSYTVTVKGAGYRTARYTVSLTGNKNLKFWNNVMDEQNAICVEEGKDDTKETVTFLAGDIVKDNKINIYDLSAVVAYFGTTGLSAINNPEYARYDLNRDGVIDSKDVAYVLVSWGK